MNADYDVIVIGGGFAGVIAARDLRKQGRAILLLEARERLGGRTWRRIFADTTQAVEFGGQWIAPTWQPFVAKEIARYNPPLSHSPDPKSIASLVDGQRLEGPLPVPPDQIFDLERVLYQLIAASHRLDSQAPLAHAIPDLDSSAAAWLAPMRLPRATYDIITAWVIGMFGCQPSEVSMQSVLAWIAAYNHSAIAVLLGESDIFANGPQSVVATIFQDSGADLQLNTPVTAVAQDSHGMTVTAQDGRTCTATAVVMAVPLNTLADIQFTPPLHAAKQAAAAERHPGRALKVWALVKGAPPNFYGHGQGPGLIWLATQFELPEGSLMAGFGAGPQMLDFAAIERNVHAFLPGAALLKVDAHDWNADPFSKGAWTAYGPGQLTRFLPGLRIPEGRIAFAGSDLAVKWAGWMEGALSSGSQAATYIDTLLQG